MIEVVARDHGISSHALSVQGLHVTETGGHVQRWTIASMPRSCTIHWNGHEVITQNFNG